MSCLNGKITRGDVLTGNISRIGKITGSCTVLCDMTAKEYIMVVPDILWLAPENNFFGEVDVFANVKWKVN